MRTYSRLEMFWLPLINRKRFPRNAGNTVQSDKSGTNKRSSESDRDTHRYEPIPNTPTRNAVQTTVSGPKVSSAMKES